MARHLQSMQANSAPSGELTTWPQTVFAARDLYILMVGLERLRTVLLAVAMLVAGLPAAGLTADQTPVSVTEETSTPEDPLDRAEIVRDDKGVPHVYTDSERALWYANGYVQAQDRLWAMDLLRHLSYGEGASVVGPGGGILEMDLDTRRNLYNQSNLEQQYEEADPEFKLAIDAFTEGINRAATEMQATGEMPAEFPALQHGFEPWESVDTVAVATFLLARFGNGGGQEVANARLFDQVSEQLPDERTTGEATVAPGTQLSAFAEPTQPAFVDEDADGRHDVGEPVYLDVGNDGTVASNDVRWTEDRFGEFVTVVDEDFGDPLTAFGPDTEIRYADVDEDGTLDADEPVYLADADFIEAGHLRLANPAAASEGSQVKAHEEDFGDPLSSLSASEAYRFVDEDDDGAHDGGEAVVFDTDTDDQASLQDVILGGENAGKFVTDGEILGVATPSEAFADLNWGDRADGYATIQETNYTRHEPHAAIKPAHEWPQAQVEATDVAVDAESFGLDADPVIDESPTSKAVPHVGMFEGEDIGPEDFRLGSNALLIAPSLSETDEALVGGGPQMGYFNPQVPYEVGLHLDAEDDEDYEAEGMGVTGAPGVIIGRSDDFAVTVTSGISDQTDTIALEATGNRTYQWDGEERQLDCRTERHRVFVPPAVWGPANQDDPQNASSPVNVVEQEVCRADLGPADKTYPITHVTRDGDGDPVWFFAKKTSSRMEEVDSAIQWLTLMEADNFDEFEDHLEGFAFTFNFHYAGTHEDTDSGEAACYVHVGRQPVRDTALDPRMPTPAGSDWVWGPDDRPTYRTGDELPRICNPEKGYLANWNNKPQDGWSSGDTRELWGSIHRVERLDQEVREATDPDGDGTVENELDLDEVKAILEDASTEDSLANQIVPPLLDGYAEHVPEGSQAALEAWAEGDAASDYPWRAGEPGTPPDQADVSNSSDDDYTDTESDLVYVDRGHTVYDRVLPALLEEVFGDELDDFVREIDFDPRNHSDVHAGDHGQHRNAFAILVDALAGTTERDWCDDANTSVDEDCAEQAEAAFAEADLTGVPADQIPHTSQHKSPFTSLGVGPSYQIPMTNRATFYHFHQGTGTSESFATLPPGASGHVNVLEFGELTANGEQPEHMNDQLDDYVDFRVKQLPWTRDQAAEDADSSQTLIVPPGLG